MQGYRRSILSVGQYVLPQFRRPSAPRRLLERFDQYAILILVFPGLDRFSEGIVRGFKRFCKRHGFDYRIVDSIDLCTIRPGQAYIFMQDEDMIDMLEQLQLLGMMAGKDIGMVSFEDSPLKRVVMDGVSMISSVSSDVFMGSSL